MVVFQARHMHSRVSEIAQEKVREALSGKDLASLRFKHMNVNRKYVSAKIMDKYRVILNLETKFYDVFTHNAYDNFLGRIGREKNIKLRKKI